jgi:hypothetical protein
MKSEKRDKIILFMSCKHSMLAKVVACLLIFIFIISNVSYGHDRSNALRQVRENRATEEAVRKAFDQPSLESPIGSPAAVFEKLMKGEELTTLGLAESTLKRDVITLRQLGLLESNGALTREAQNAASAIFQVLDNLPREGSRKSRPTSQYRNLVILPQIQLAMLLENERSSPQRDTREKVLKSIVSTNKKLSFDLVVGYSRIAEQLADYLIRINQDDQIFAVIDGITSSGKSTLTAYLLYALEQKRNRTGNWLELDLISIRREERNALWKSFADALDRGEGANDQYDVVNYRPDAMSRFMRELNSFLQTDVSSGEILTFSERAEEKTGSESKPFHLLPRRDTILENEFAILFASKQKFKNKPVNVRVVSDHEDAIRRKHRRAIEVYRDVEDVTPGSPYMKAREGLNASALATTKRVQEETDHLVDVEAHILGEPSQWKIVIRKTGGRGREMPGELGRHIEGAPNSLNLPPMQPIMPAPSVTEDKGSDLLDRAV